MQWTWAKSKQIIGNNLVKKILLRLALKILMNKSSKLIYGKTSILDENWSKMGLLTVGMRSIVIYETLLFYFALLAL